MKNKRIVYFCVFISLFAVETSIALFVRDGFVRPYVGDVLVTALLSALLRTFFPEKPKLLPLFAVLFAFSVEAVQLFDIVKLLGLSDNRIISIVVGRVFDVTDLICYAVGGLIFIVAETAIIKYTSSRENKNG